MEQAMESQWEEISQCTWMYVCMALDTECGEGLGQAAPLTCGAETPHALRVLTATSS